MKKVTARARAPANRRMTHEYYEIYMERGSRIYTHNIIIISNIHGIFRTDIGLFITNLYSYLNYDLLHIYIYICIERVFVQVRAYKRMYFNFFLFKFLSLINSVCLVIFSKIIFVHTYGPAVVAQCGYAVTDSRQLFIL